MDNLFTEREKDLLFFGLNTGRIKNDFKVGNLLIKPSFNLGEYLNGYSEHSKVFVQDEAIFGSIINDSVDDTPPFTLFIEDFYHNCL